jgi:NADPH:quinone reductase-like Zn-dependent oxidoreductase
MRIVGYQEFGGPEVMQLEEAPIPDAGPGQIRIAVRAAALNPADWVIREGAMEMESPGGIGLDAAGVVDQVGPGVEGVEVGDEVAGFAVTPAAAEHAVLAFWGAVPDGLDFVQAAALPLTVETSFRALDLLEVSDDDTLLIHGAGGAVGTLCTQLAVARGATVIGTASPANRERLRSYGALVTGYEDGLSDRLAELVPEGIDKALDMSPPGSLPELIRIVGDAANVLTISDHEGAAANGVRASGRAGTVNRWETIPAGLRLAAAGRLELPVQRTFPLEKFAEAAAISEAKHLSGKLVLVP